MTPEQDYVFKCLAQWFKIRDENNLPFPISADQLQSDVNHSSLLPRLLSGKEPLLIPPPKRSGFPWYELVEEGSATQISAKLFESYPGRKHPVVLINQFLWDLVQKSSDTELIVRYHPDTPLYRVWLENLEEPDHGWSIEVYPQGQLDI